MNRDDAELELAALLLERRRLARFDLAPSPRVVQRIRSLELVLYGVVRLARRRVPSVVAYARITLSPPEPRVNHTGTTVNHHRLVDESGAEVGHVQIVPRNDGRHLHVQWIGAGTQDTGNVLGAEAVRSAVRSLREHYPDAEFVSGLRTSGFRNRDKEAGDVNEVVPGQERTVVALPRRGLTRTEATKMTRATGDTGHPASPELINHAGAVLDDPTSDVAVLSLADHLQDEHPDDPHARAFLKWVNGEETWAGMSDLFRPSAYHPEGGNNSRGGSSDQPYIELRPRYTVSGVRPRTTYDVEPIGRLSKRADDPHWRFYHGAGPRARRGVRPADHPTHPGEEFRRDVPTPGYAHATMTSNEVARHLHDVDGLRGLILGVIGARQYHPDTTADQKAGVRFRMARGSLFSQGSSSKLSRRRVVKYAHLPPPDQVQRRTVKPLVEPESGSTSDRVNQDLRLFRQHVRSKYNVRHPKGVRPNTPEERVLLHDYAVQRGLVVKKGDRPFYEASRHTFYHPTPGDKVAVASDYIKEGRGRVKLARPRKKPAAAPQPDNGPRYDAEGFLLRPVDRETAGEPFFMTSDPRVKVHVLYRGTVPSLGYHHKTFSIAKGQNGTHKWFPEDWLGRYASVDEFKAKASKRYKPLVKETNPAGQALTPHELWVHDLPGGEPIIAPSAEDALGRPDESIPEDYYAMRRRGAPVRYGVWDHVKRVVGRVMGSDPPPANVKGVKSAPRTDVTAWHAPSLPPTKGKPPGRFKPVIGETVRNPTTARDALRGGPSTREGRVAAWANRHAANHAQEMADRFGWDFKKAHRVLHHALHTAAMQVTRTGKDVHGAGVFDGKRIKVNVGVGQVPYSRRGTPVRKALVNRHDFLGALKRMVSSNHADFVKRAEGVATQMGMHHTKVLPALHDTVTGSVPGVAQAVYGESPPDRVSALAAWVNGLLPNGPGYAVFHLRPQGPDTLYRFRHDGSGMDIRSKLDRAGIRSRIMVPHRRGFDVLVPDIGNKLGNAVNQYATQHGVQVEASPGYFKTAGSATDQAQSRDTFRNDVVRGEQYRRRDIVRKYGAETTEDDFHRMLDANPDDHHTRLVFADWLQERGDPRAEGYRALGKVRVRPWDQDLGEQYNNEPGYTHSQNQQVVAGDPRYVAHALPYDWFRQIEGDNSNPSWTFHNSRRDAEDAAAIAFTQLPQKRKAEIINLTRMARPKNHVWFKLIDAARKVLKKVPTGPDYQKLFWHDDTKRAHWVSADGDEEGHVKKIHRTLKKVPGVKKVTGDAESRPAGEGWVEIPVKRKSTKKSRRQLVGA